MNRRKLLQAALAAPALALLPSWVDAVDYGPPFKGVPLWTSGIRETIAYHAGQWPRYSYTYDVDLALGIAVGPMQHSIRRIWSGDERPEICWYDTRPRQPGEHPIGYRDRACLTDAFAQGMVVYPGTEDQPVSPLISPGHYKPRKSGQLRCYSNLAGLHYVTLQEFPLTQHGNRIPDFWFESV